MNFLKSTDSRALQHFPVVDYALSTLKSDESINLTTKVLDECLNILTKQIQGKITFDQSSNIFFKLAGSNSPCKIISKIIFTIENHSPMTNFILSQNPTRKCRMWSKDEDIILLAGIHKYGLGDWKSISQYVGNGRTRSQCSQRWSRALDPKIVKEPWTEEEDSTLIQAVKDLGEHAWATIAKRISTRSDVQCRYRYFQLNKKNYKYSINSSDEECIKNIQKKTEENEKQLKEQNLEEKNSKENKKQKNTEKNKILAIPPVKNCSQVLALPPKTFVQHLLEVDLFNCPLNQMIPPLKIQNP